MNLQSDAGQVEPIRWRKGTATEHSARSSRFSILGRDKPRSSRSPARLLPQFPGRIPTTPPLLRAPARLMRLSNIARCELFSFPRLSGLRVRRNQRDIRDPHCPAELVFEKPTGIAIQAEQQEMRFSSRSQVVFHIHPWMRAREVLRAQSCAVGM